MSTRRCRIAKLTHDKEFRKKLIAEIWEAKRKKDFASVWRLLHLLAQQHRGPRKRIYNLPDPCKPSRYDWEKFVRLPACAGGLGAETFYDLDQELEQVLADRLANDPPAEQGQHWVMAQRDINDIKWFLRQRAKKRRGFPPWSLPAEIWTMILWPSLRQDKPTGLGAVMPELSCARAERCITDVLSQMRRVHLAPMRWHISKAWDIPKHDHKSGPAGRRIVHGFCPFGKAWSSCAAGRAPHRWLAPYAHGYEKHRRREDAIAVHLIASYRLRQSDVSHSNDGNDATNAFSCCLSAALIEHASDMYLEEDQCFFEQRIKHNAAMISGRDGHFFAAPSQGTLMGHPNASKEFAWAYQSNLHSYQVWHQSLPTGRWLFARDLRGRMRDLSFTSYADDTLSKTILAGRVDASTWAWQSDLATEKFDSCLLEGGFETNRDKKEVQPLKLQSWLRLD